MEIKNLKKVILFGAGGLLSSSIKYLNSNNIEVCFISDNNDQIHGKTLNNIQVIPPNKIINYDYPVLITSTYSNDIAKQLMALGVKEYYDFSYIGEYDRWKNHFNVKLLKENNSKIQEVLNILEDEESKMVFNSLIKYRQTSNPIYIKKANYIDYFHPLVSPKENDVIIDGGAWQGDSCIEFNNRLNNNCKIYSFEPDFKNYSILVQNTKLYDNVIAIKFGLFDRKKTLYFQESEFVVGLGHRVVDYETSVKIEVVDLDTISKTWIDNEGNEEIIDFIKMDIEGSEVKAILGAERILKNQKPKLAICIYHLYDDLWEIPLLIRKINSSYKFYMGHHAQNFAETVIYAI
ncbi:FkbM family methyltransferase [Aliarcobacter butzleri]|uniref:FkbM family methyltransferase n=1 Tax=Aliarcobacter butzleri TaxID=28197 RepID=UPI0021B66190|nr:FkbM family methyltransferase [Aliarcobacter butzleri]MCT7588132.1 FkbM family methyltransferase [Aliarcobacter butzleri]